MKRITIDRSAEIPRTYEELVKIYLPRPLHDRVDYNNASEVVDWLAVRTDLNHEQYDYLEIISNMIEAYDAKHTDLGGPEYRGLNALKAILEEHDIKGIGLSEILGLSITMGSKILRGERELTKEHMKILGKKFNVDPALFMDQ